MGWAIAAVGLCLVVLVMDGLGVFDRLDGID